MEYETSLISPVLVKKETSIQPFSLKKKNDLQPRKTDSTEKNVSKPIEKWNNNAIEIVISRTQITIKLPKNEIDIQFLRSFKYARWDTALFRWIIPNKSKNANNIKTYFSDRNAQIIDLASQQATNTERPNFTKNEMLVVNHSNRKLKVYFGYSKDIAVQIKRIPYSTWNGYESCWEISYSEKFMEELSLIALQNSLEFRVQIINKSKIKPRKSKYDIANYRECPENYINKLKELRYSRHTMDSYTDLFEEFSYNFV